MRVFVDACIDPRVAALLKGHEVATAFDLEWHALRDHVMLLRIQDQFDALLTADKGFEFQHNLSKLRFGIIVVHVLKNKVEFYRPLFPQIMDAFDRIGPGKAAHVRK